MFRLIVRSLVVGCQGLTGISLISYTYHEEIAYRIGPINMNSYYGRFDKHSNRISQEHLKILLLNDRDGNYETGDKMRIFIYRVINFKHYVVLCNTIICEIRKLMQDYEKLSLFESEIWARLRQQINKGEFSSVLDLEVLIAQATHFRKNVQFHNMVRQLSRMQKLLVTNVVIGMTSELLEKINIICDFLSGHHQVSMSFKRYINRASVVEKLLLL